MASFYQTKLDVNTKQKTNFVNVTEQVQQAVALSGVGNGLCMIMHVHSTAGLILDSIGDPKTSDDLESEIDRLVPTRVDFHHTYDTPRDASGHVKAMLVGQSVMVPLENGRLVLGRSTGILFCEFDGPRERSITVQIWF